MPQIAWPCERSGLTRSYFELQADEGPQVPFGLVGARGLAPGVVSSKDGALSSITSHPQATARSHLLHLARLPSAPPARDADAVAEAAVPGRMLRRAAPRHARYATMPAMRAGTRKASFLECTCETRNCINMRILAICSRPPACRGPADIIVNSCEAVQARGRASLAAQGRGLQRTAMSLGGKSLLMMFDRGEPWQRQWVGAPAAHGARP